MTFEDMKKLKHIQQESDKLAMKNGKLKQEDLSLFRNFDKSKARIVKSWTY